MKNLYVITLEKIEQRYTKQWYKLWKQEFSKEFNVIYIDGPEMSDIIDKGRFLDINKTNIWKAKQVETISKLFAEGKIKDEDKFIFMDGWHFGITALKYMAQLSNIRSQIYTFFHAGSWDKFDFVSQAGLGKWAKHNERGWFRACDGHFVATKFHKQLILKYFGDKSLNDKIHVVGFPANWMQFIKDENIQSSTGKKNLVIFPHRLDKEKQPEVFDKIDARLSKSTDTKFVKTLEVTKNKKEYYELIRDARVCFSSSLQETYGIGTVEALMFGVIPLVPDTLSYVELYDKQFRYKDFNDAANKMESFLREPDKYMNQLYDNQKNMIRQSLEAIPLMCKYMKKIEE